jgi:hypothetical protein
MQARLGEMERRMLRNYMATGIGLTLGGPALMIAPVPFGFWIGLLVLVVGILSIVRAASLSSNIKNKQPPQSP